MVPNIVQHPEIWPYRAEADNYRCITPEDGVVKHFANVLTFDISKGLVYKDTKMPLMLPTSYDSTICPGCPNGDYPRPANFTLCIGGDCFDVSAAKASIYTKLGYNARILGLYYRQRAGEPFRTPHAVVVISVGGSNGNPRQMLVDDPADEGNLNSFQKAIQDCEKVTICGYNQTTVDYNSYYW
jgi:hypothetical protein